MATPAHSGHRVTEELLHADHLVDFVLEAGPPLEHPTRRTPVPDPVRPNILESGHAPLFKVENSPLTINYSRHKSAMSPLKEELPAH